MVRRAWSVVAFLTLLLASGVPALVQAAALTNAMSAGLLQNDAPAVDLAAAALNPEDLNGAGLAGFGQQASVSFGLWTELSQSQATLGPNATALQNAVGSPGFARGYERELGLPSRPGVPSSHQRAFVSTLILQFASPETAAADFESVTAGVSSPQNQTNAGGATVGDESQYSQYRALSRDGDPYQAMAVTFRSGALIAIVTAGDFSNRQPDPTQVELLGQAQLGKLLPDQLRGNPGLGKLIVRLGGEAVETRSDEYGRLDGKTFPNYSESAEDFAKRNDRYGAAIDVYGVGQAIAAGSPATTDDIRYSSLLYRFADDVAAAAWLQDGLTRAADSPNIVTATPVNGAASIGEASLTIAIATARGGAGTARGYLIDAQVGAQVAQIQLLGIPDVPQSAIEDLAVAQVACLMAGACPERMAVPEDLPLAAASPVAGTPTSGGSGTNPIPAPRPRERGHSNFGARNPAASLDTQVGHRAAEHYLHPDRRSRFAFRGLYA